MRQAAKWLGLVAVAAVMVPFAENPGFFEGTRILVSPALAQSAVDRKAEADQLFQQGIQHAQVSQFREALRSWEQALSIYREINDRDGEGNVLGNLGIAYANLGQYAQAIGFFEQDLAIARETGNLAGESRTLGNLGLAYFSQGQYTQAVDFFEQSLTIARMIGNLSSEGIALGNLGLIYFSQGQYPQAIEFFEQHLALAREIGHLQGEGNALGNLGSAYNSQGQYEQAIEYFEQHLTIAQKIGDRAGEGHALGNLGLAYNSLGQYAQAINFLEKSLRIAQEISERAAEGSAFGNLGAVYANIGQYTQAINLQEQSLAIARQVGDRDSEGIALGNLGVSYNELELYQEAIKFHEQHLAIAREIGKRDGEGVALLNLGNTYANLGQYAQAIVFYEQSLAIAREIGDREGEGGALGNLGLAHYSLGQYIQAIDYHEKSLAVAREIRDRDTEANALSNQGLAFIRTGQFPQAASVLQQSVEVYESLRIDLPDNQLIAIADTQRKAYANMERALIAQGNTTEALAIAERSRARAFVLQLASRFANANNPASITESSFVKAPTITEIQQIARDTNNTLVTYSQIFDQALYIWVVQPSGEIAFRSVEFEGSGDAGFAINPITAIDGPVFRSAPDDSKLGQLVADSRASIVIESTNTRPEQLRDLHTLLIDPIADLLPTDPEAKVVFVPQGNLFLVPFAALQDDEGTYLIEKHTILTAPSIQVFGLANEAASTTAGANGRSPFSADNALIVGNPTMPTVWSPTASGDFAETQLSDLPGAKAEAEAIGGFLNITPLIGPQATEARVKQRLPSARLIHLATHGLLDYGDPRAYGTLDVPGAIALTPDSTEDGLLTSAEILEMDLQAELAVLSACDTGRGRITGDGVVGLSRSLITAGVPSVVVSLWAVPDAPTAELMTEFYRQLDQGQDKAQALRQAMLTTLEQHPNPRNWAAFTLIGAAE